MVVSEGSGRPRCVEASDEVKAQADALGEPGEAITHLELVPLGPLVHDAAEAMVADPSTFSVPTGFADLDHLTGGLVPGALWVISGHTGVGKSVLAMDFVRSAAVRHGHPTLLVSRTESVERLARRLLAAQARVPLPPLLMKPRQQDKERLEVAAQVLEAAPLVLAHGEAFNVRSLDEAVTASPGDPERLQLLIIDHLLARELPDALPYLRRFALGHQVAVVAVAQLDPRDRHARVNVDQIADISLTVHRKDLYPGATPAPSAGEATFIITRHRSGPIGRIQVAFQGQYGRFVDLQE